MRSMTDYNKSGMLLFLFACSGVSGLIYQSVWSHYLGLTLGHAAYAQTLVLAIFMGAMAVGAWWASRRSHTLANPIAAYAVIEGVIGLMGLSFHTIFVTYVNVSQSFALPALSDTTAHVYQWVTAALLILPQCLLLGTTFPLLSAGFIRVNKVEDGQALGGLYFSNSFGAAIGALVATFYLLPKIGMPGAMLAGGVLNLAVAIGAWIVSQADKSAVLAVEKSSQIEETSGTGTRAGAAAKTYAAPDASRYPIENFLGVICLSAAITGATSFAYEIVWVRMLNQALGTTLHSFELMLASFILGLAFGGLWIARKSEQLGDAVRYAGIAQVAMGIAALLSALVFANSFVWVEWLTKVLPPTSMGYTQYNLASTAIALLVMFPAAFFAGMTLPLFTMALLRTGHGESSVGKVYSANTAGAIVGVLVTVHSLIPSIGLHLTLVVAAVIDVLLGLVLLRFVWGGSSVVLPAVLGGIGVLTVATAVQWGKPNTVEQVSGAFRTGRMLDATTLNIPFLRDGKTSTVGVLHFFQAGVASIVTNGKPDASLTLGLEQRPTPDEPTMVMAATIPMAIHPAPKTVGIIGWGSGLTTHTVLGNDQITLVDTVEIEKEMYAGAKLFGSRVARAYNDKRSNLILEDARTYFATGARKYDIIISEPSNPWVNGVASLFTDEFYQFLTNHLQSSGVLVQWLQSYEMNDRLLGTMVASLRKTFPYVDLYLANDADLIFVASMSPLQPIDYSKLKSAALQRELPRLGLSDANAFQIKRIGGQGMLDNFVKVTGAKSNSDYHPILAFEAPRSRFMHDRAAFLHSMINVGLPVLEMLDSRKAVSCYTPSANVNVFRLEYRHILGCDLAKGFSGKGDPIAKLEKVSPELAAMVSRTRELSKTKVTDENLEVWSAGLAELARLTIETVPKDELETMWITPTWISAGQTELVSQILDAYKATAQRNPAKMKEFASKVLDSTNRNVAGILREQMLVIALLGAAALGEHQAVLDLEHRHGPSIVPSEDMTAALQYLLAYADRG